NSFFSMATAAKASACCTGPQAERLHWDLGLGSWVHLLAFSQLGAKSNGVDQLHSASSLCRRVQLFTRSRGIKPASLLGKVVSVTCIQNVVLSFMNQVHEQRPESGGTAPSPSESQPQVQL
uniref:Uncharacterized protein n=1 Tax=Salarias fasciatus TaxID=181472 RepID=A0A672GXZ1_SALFA